MYFFASLMRSRWRSTNLLQKFFLREKKNSVFSLDIQGCELQQILSQKGKGFFGFKTKKFKLGGFATKKFPVSRKTSPCKRKTKLFLSTSFFRFMTKISSLVNPLKHQCDTSWAWHMGNPMHHADVSHWAEPVFLSLQEWTPTANQCFNENCFSATCFWSLLFMVFPTLSKVKNLLSLINMAAMWKVPYHRRISLLHTS